MQGEQDSQNGPLAVSLQGAKSVSGGLLEGWPPLHFSLLEHCQQPGLVLEAGDKVGETWPF